MNKIFANEFHKGTIPSDGNKYLLGNGYLGCRGTLDEYTKKELVGLNLPGLYDEVWGKWCESVNSPNPFYTFVEALGKRLTLPETEPVSHYQELDLDTAVFSRETTFLVNDVHVTLSSRRFVSKSDLHLSALHFELKADQDLSVFLYTGVDTDIWDINGPHLDNVDVRFDGKEIVYRALTQEAKIPLLLRETIDVDHFQTAISEKAYLRKIDITLKKDEPFSFNKMAYIAYGRDGTGYFTFEGLSYDILFERHKQEWERLWYYSNIEIKGDEFADLMLRYSIYHLLIIAPKHSSSASIPARGLSGQVYKGAIFWDTEMFMLPFYLLTDPMAAQTLIRYRLDRLEGALKKARELGFEGAYFPWESVKDGIEGCSYFNVTDVFTNRPVRTYFRDKQIHISGDVVYGLGRYLEATGDSQILFDGGLEVLEEVARFYDSYLYYKENKDRYEVLDVTGPDEYHERVNNNAFTNYLIRYSFAMFLQALDIARNADKKRYQDFMKKHDLKSFVSSIRRKAKKLYLPAPDQEGIIEQFDGYFRLEDITLPQLFARKLHPNEYLGASGLASTTQIIKQADVVTMLCLFGNQFVPEVLKANFNYYEPRTEHGSSLSASMYSLLAIKNGEVPYAYDFFLKSASIDYTGHAKEYAGGIYIGGSHPASAGGAYLSVVYGFLGFEAKGETFTLNPKLPESFSEVSLRIRYRHKLYRIIATREQTKVTEEEDLYENKTDHI